MVFILSMPIRGYGGLKPHDERLKMKKKILPHKSYGSIPHLFGSRLGEGEHHIDLGRAKIATSALRNKNDRLFVTEKLDGSNVGVLRQNNEIIALGRAGYLAETSPWRQHHLFAHFVKANRERFMSALKEGQRFIGEWLLQVHGTLYVLPHEPFVIFDLMEGQRRLSFPCMLKAARTAEFTTPRLLNMRFDAAMSIESAMDALGDFGYHGAQDKPEGAVWRVESRVRDGADWQYHFLCKYVRSDKVDGKYFVDEKAGETPRWNEVRVENA